MLDFVQHALLGVTLVLTLTFTRLLGLLWGRTRSMGLISITAVLIFRSTIGLIPGTVIKPFLDQWSRGELNNWLTQHMTIGGTTLCNFVSRVLHNGLLALGTFLIYREWSGGKIRWNPLKSSEVANHA